MAKGAGFEVSDILLVAAIGGSAYFLYKTLANPLEDISQGAGDLLSLPTDIYSDIKSGGAALIRALGQSGKPSVYLPVERLPAFSSPQVSATFGDLQIIQTPKGSSGVYSSSKGVLTYKGQGYSTAFPVEMVKKLEQVQAAGAAKPAVDKVNKVFKNPWG